MSEELIKRIDNHFRARAGVINIVYTDLQYTLEAIAKACDNTDKKLISKTSRKPKPIRHVFRYSISCGLREWMDGYAVDKNKDIEDWIQVLLIIKNTNVTEGHYNVYIIENPQWTMDEHSFVQQLIDLSHICPETHKSIILLTPSLSLPPELEKMVNVINAGLPNMEDLNKLYNEEEGKLKTLEEFTAPSKKTVKEIKQNLTGLTQREVGDVMCFSAVKEHTLTKEQIVKYKEGVIRKTGILEYIPSSEGLEHVGGLEELKKWLQERKEGFSQEARTFNVPLPRGFVMVGVSGCGKSLISKVCAHHYNMPLIRFDVGKVFGSLLGESEANMQKVLSILGSIGQCVLWIDEIDKEMAGLKGDGRSDGGVGKRVFGAFLNWLQENQEKPVFLVATCNDISMLPPELLRKGRFDELFFVDLPNEIERAEIFKIHLMKVKRKPENFDIKTLVKETEGFSGAEIEASIKDGLFKAFHERKQKKDNKIDLSTEHILEAINETKPLSVTMKDDLERLRTYVAPRCRPASSTLTLITEKNRGKDLEL